MYIERNAQKELEKALLNRKVLIILGARQVGKTTMVKHFLHDKKTAFFNFDIEVDKDKFFALAALPPESVLQILNNPDYIVIDEAHRKTETSRIVKGWFDSGLNVKIIMLGSSNIDIANQTSESLAGRNEKIFLPPLLFRESLKTEAWFSADFDNEIIQEKFSNQLSEILLHRIVYGNYPEVLTVSDKESYLLNLTSDYLLKDVLQLGLVKDPELIRRLLMLIAYQIGGEVSVNEIATSLKISRVTVEKYLDLLERTYVIFRLPSWSTNPRKEITKNQKLYFWDTGVRNALIKEFVLNNARQDIGKLWENWAVAEFAKANLLSGDKKSLYFWRSRSGGEVDLVIKSGEILSALEFKWKKKTTSANKAFENLYGIKVTTLDSSVPLTIADLAEKY